MLQRNVLFNLQVFGDFPAIFLFLISSFIVEQTLCDFNSFKLVELHFMAQKVNIYWWMSHVSLRIMFNILLLDEVACSCQLCPVDQWASSSVVPLLIFCLLDLSISDRQVSKSPSKNNSGLIYLFS